MKLELTVGFRVSLFDVSNPNDVLKLIKPEKCIDSIWIPQTMGDQVWIWFEFETPEEKQKYIDGLMKITVKKSFAEHNNKGKFVNFKKDVKYDPREHFMLDSFTQEEIDHWTNLYIFKIIINMEQLENAKDGLISAQRETIEYLNSAVNLQNDTIAKLNSDLSVCRQEGLRYFNTIKAVENYVGDVEEFLDK